MVQINKSELRRFLSHSSKIKGRNIIPILDYVKLECVGEKATLTKTNTGQFVICEVDAEWGKDFSCLIEESTLRSAAKYGKDNVITISLKGKNISLDDGEKENNCQAMNVKDFSAIQMPETEDKFELSKEEILSMNIARMHTTGREKEEGWKNLIHFTKIRGKNYLIASDGYVFYSRKVESNVPYIAIEPEVISFINGAPSANYMDGKKYGYFETGGTLFGFIKSEYKIPDISSFFDGLNTEDGFLVEKDKVRDYCESALEVSSGNGVESVKFLDGGENNIVLQFSDLAGDQSATQEIKVDGKKGELESTALLPRQLLTVLKATNSEIIKMTKQTGRFLVTTDDDPEYAGVVQQVAFEK